MLFRSVVCRHYSRAYLHHLYHAKEMLASRLNTIHNLWYFSDFMRRMRLAIAEGGFPAFRDAFYRQRQEQAGSGACDEECREA